MKELLLELCALDAAPGSEEKVRDYIMEQVSSYVSDLSIDTLGNLIVCKKGSKTPKNRLLLTAHMDEVALRVSEVCDDGLIKFQKSGNIEDIVLPSARVRSSKGVPGAVVYPDLPDAPPLTEERKPSTDSLRIECGSTTKDAAQASVKVGDFFVFDGGCIELGAKRVSCKAIENRLGCAVLVELIRSDLPFDTWFAFTVCGEIIDAMGDGGRGASVAAERVKPTISLNVCCFAAADFPEVPKHKQMCRLGEGAVISPSDRRAPYNRPLRQMLQSEYSAAGLKWQAPTVRGQLCDSGSVYTASRGVKIAGVAAPVRNIRTGRSIIDLEDAKAVFDISRLFIEKAGDFDA